MSDVDVCNNSLRVMQTCSFLGSSVPVPRFGMGFHPKTQPVLVGKSHPSSAASQLIVLLYCGVLSQGSGLSHVAVDWDLALPGAVKML